MGGFSTPPDHAGSHSSTGDDPITLGNVVSPGTSGNILYSNGSAWASGTLANTLAPGSAGNIPYSDGSAWASGTLANALAPGSAGNTMVSNGTSWTSAACISSGLFAARPAASASNVGLVYREIDHTGGTCAWWYCASATEWVLMRDFGPEKAAIGPSTANNCGLICLSSISTAPLMGTGCSGVIMFYPTGSPAGTEYLFDTRDSAGTARGFAVTTGNNAGDRHLLKLQWHRGSGAFESQEVANTYSGALNTVHALAWTHTGGNVRTVWDGALSATVTAKDITSHVARQAGDRISILENIAGTYTALTTCVVAIKTFSTVVADADMTVCTDATARGNCHIPTPSGATVTFDFDASRYPDGVIRHTISGNTFGLGYTGYSYSTMIKRSLV